MPVLKTYDLFLSHVWEHNDEYKRLENLLKKARLFKWRNYSVPESKSLVHAAKPVSKALLKSLLSNHVKPVNCVLFIGGMYMLNREWIEEEIRISQLYSKPIIAIYPWGAQRMPSIVKRAAHEIVRWNTDSIVSAIRRNSI